MQNPPMLDNLRLLVARATTLGSPSSKNFCAYLKAGGTSIQEAQLSRWLMRDESLMSWDARRIEKAMSVPSGWLDEDLGFVFQASPNLLKAFRCLAALPADQQVAFEKLFEALASQLTTPKSQL